jgi:hypothetical protein
VQSSSRDLELILGERARQISEEGWTPEHDDTHNNQQLAQAGHCYLLWAQYQLGKIPSKPLAPWEQHQKQYTDGKKVILPWPWAKRWWKPNQPVRNLTKAGALFLAEIDRMKRLSAPKSIIKPLANKCELCARAIDELQALGRD